MGNKYMINGIAVIMFYEACELMQNQSPAEQTEPSGGPADLLFGQSQVIVEAL